MNVAKIAAAPMLRMIGIRLPSSAQVKPPIESRTIDILMAIVLLSMGGFTCEELGKRIPIIRNIGAAAIFATFIPSFLAFHYLLPDSILDSVKDFTKDSNFLYLFISCIIVGSILGMDRGVLIKGFLKIFVPLAAGSVAGGIVGTLVGVALGLGAYHTFFFVVVPIMAG